MESVHGLLLACPTSNITKATFVQKTNLGNKLGFQVLQLLPKQPFHLF